VTTREELWWRKASRSSNTGDNCVEIALRWGGAGRGDDTGADCVEGALPGLAVRDSKNTSGPRLAFDAASFAAFLRALEADRLG
jgi:hypothetical protein